MNSINTEKIKPGDQLFAFDFNLRIWMKCKIIHIAKYMITLEGIEGRLKGIPWYEPLEALKDPDYYRSINIIPFPGK